MNTSINNIYIKDTTLAKHCKDAVSACWDTCTHLKRSGGIAFQLVTRAQHLYPNFSKL